MSGEEFFLDLIERITCDPAVALLLGEYYQERGDPAAGPTLRGGQACWSYFAVMTWIIFAREAARGRTSGPGSFRSDPA